MIPTKHLVRNFIILGIIAGLGFVLFLTIDSPKSLTDELILTVLCLGIFTSIGALAGWICRKLLESMFGR
jgi:hypothetical protein